jgi:hypothetical protein
MILPRILILGSVVLLTLGIAAPVFGVPLDAPSAQLLSADRTSIALQVQAGPSGAPAGFIVEWLPADEYHALGGWPVTGAGVQVGEFSGVPTLNAAPQTGSYHLGSLESVTIVLGRLFDETGVACTNREELPEGTTFMIRVCASAGNGLESSAPSATLAAATLPPNEYDCTLTQGFWKNHPESWLRVSSIALGTVTYSRTQLLDILGQPARGNGLVSLAHQLIAARLNLLLGATAPPGVAAAIVQADALIGGRIVPPIGSGTLSPGLTSGLTDLLDDFNSGRLGPGHCPDGHRIVSVTGATWGALKSFYR